MRYKNMLFNRIHFLKHSILFDQPAVHLLSMVKKSTAYTVQHIARHKPWRISGPFFLPDQQQF